MFHITAKYPLESNKPHKNVATIKFNDRQKAI